MQISSLNKYIHMKQTALFFALLITAVNALGVTYYSQGSLAPSSLSSWNSQRGGGGSTPSSFTNTSDQFVIQSGHSMITTGTWTFGASGSILEIENGGLLQGDHSILLTGTLQIDNGGTYIHNNNASVSSSPGASIFGGTFSL